MKRRFQQPQPTSRPEPPTVLIVDDDRDVCGILSRLVAAIGMKAEVICEPATVLDHMKESHYDVMLLDITMPGMSGIELLPKVLEIAPTTKVIMVSGNADAKLVTESHRLGAFDFLKKPVQLKLLSNSVHRALEKDAAQGHAPFQLF